MEKNVDRIEGVPISEILVVAAEVTAAATTILLTKGSDRKGGYLVIRKRDSGEILLHEKVGTIAPPESDQRYLTFAKEKGERLGPNGLSSWQSRNLQQEKYGGAIATSSGLIVSFSGLPELWDEALVLVISNRLGWISGKEVFDIIEISGNTFVELLLGTVLLNQ